MTIFDPIYPSRLLVISLAVDDCPYHMKTKPPVPTVLYFNYPDQPNNFHAKFFKPAKAYLDSPFDVDAKNPKTATRPSRYRPSHPSFQTEQGSRICRLHWHIFHLD